jgi:UDP:flavonoid glycosyltransferase YjiC (YdhE family)
MPDYEPVIACDSRYRRFLEHEHFPSLPLRSISSGQFLKALAKGSPVYDLETLREYVNEDLKLIRVVMPDLIVGDFRLSLAVSARLAGVRYAAISNAYWSPYYARTAYPLPVLPITRVLPLAVANALFQWARPLAFRFHCKPLNQLRREHGMAAFGADLRHAYTDADYVLYADSEQLFPTQNLPSSHRYVGPIIWSPPVPLPDWWDKLPTERPVIYLTLGSSGQASLANLVVDALADLPVTVIVSTAGAVVAPYTAPNVFVADYLPGAHAASRSKLVICNGGSPTCHQALAAGVPVLGIASNMDQFLNMQAIELAGAGAVMRADRVQRPALRAKVQRMLSSREFSQSAEGLAHLHSAADAPRRFAAFADEAAGCPPLSQPSGAAADD